MERPRGRRRLAGHLAANALIAAVYAAVSLVLPATAFANYRLTTSLYTLAAFDPALIPGLALGNALAGLPQGPVDVLLGGIVGLATSAACWRLGPRWAPLGVLVVPTLVVPLWLSALFHVPYAAVLPVLLVGQALSALLAWVAILPAARRVFGSASG